MLCNTFPYQRHRFCAIILSKLMAIHPTGQRKSAATGKLFISILIYNNSKFFFTFIAFL